MANTPHSQCRETEMAHDEAKKGKRRETDEMTICNLGESMQCAMGQILHPWTTIR